MLKRRREIFNAKSNYIFMIREHFWRVRCRRCPLVTLINFMLIYCSFSSITALKLKITIWRTAIYENNTINFRSLKFAVDFWLCILYQNSFPLNELTWFSPNRCFQEGSTLINRFYMVSMESSGVDAWRPSWGLQDLGSHLFSMSFLDSSKFSSRI